MYFQYGKVEMEYLKSRDKKLGEVIDCLGYLEKKVDEDLFSSVIHHIIGQQISMAAQATIWKRAAEQLGGITVETVSMASIDDLQKLGTSFRKAEYIKSFADQVQSGKMDLDALYHKTDAEIVKELSALKGIGVWTAEMIMTFCMQRPDILSYGDLAIHRGMRMLYHHREMNQKLFEKYRRRYSPYGTVASLYLWTISNGVVAGMRDYAPAKKVVKSK